SVPAEERGRWLVELEQVLVEHIAHAEAATPPTPARLRNPVRAALGRARAGTAARLHAVARPFAVAMQAMTRVPTHLVRRPGDFLTIARRVLAQTLLRPLI